MKKKYDRINSILFVSVIVLFLSFVLSFVFSGSHKERKVSLKTALVNPKTSDSITFFEIKSGREILDFVNDKGVWFCGNYTEDGSFFVPAKKEKVTGFINELCTVRTFEKITSRNKSDFGLTDEKAFVLTYTDSGNSYELLFGDSDFSGTGVYVSGGESSQVLLGEKKSFEKYLYTGLNQWCDPYLIARNFEREFKESDFMNLKDKSILELRHGGISFYIPSENEKPSKIMNIEMGDTSHYELKFYKIPDTHEYHIQALFTDRNKNEFRYSVKISEWTYNKLD